MEFELTEGQLLDIANDYWKKIETGLKLDNTEIKAIPAYIHPQKEGLKGDAIVLDLGGTNCRAAVVSVDGDHITVGEVVEREISEMKKSGFSEQDLHASQLKLIEQLPDFPKGLPVGYCFSYPAKSLSNGDAELIKWVKGVNIANMEGKPVGKPLLEYFNRNTDYGFQKIAVVNDTITSLFAGLKNSGYDAYIGLIVGTGTNMATFFPSGSISKLKGEKSFAGETPINLESGNFFPPHLMAFDEVVDRNSDNPGIQRFEKAVSGMYLGQIFRTAAPDAGFNEEMDAAQLTHMINHPGDYEKKHVELAYCIYERSAKLVAASLAGLIKSLHNINPSIMSIHILAEGSLFWSTLNQGQMAYVEIVNTWLNKIIADLGLGKKQVILSKMENANLIGAAIAVINQ